MWQNEMRKKRDENEEDHNIKPHDRKRCEAGRFGQCEVCLA
jgi:RNA polymerase-binding transcription factor DksA